MNPFLAYIIHTHGRPNGISAVILSDEEYPKMVAQSLLSKVCSEFLERYPISTIKNAQPNSLPYPELKDYLVKYQDPGQADSMMKIQNELDETVVVMQKNISVMMDRGEKLDDLVQKSETLSAQSKMFYTQVG
jgi:synaptobrevin family protein YKT6